MSSASSPVKSALEGYVAGRLQAERLVIAVAAAFYGREDGRGQAEGLLPLIDVIDRAAPGIVELGSVAASPGFEIRLAERPFPRQYEAELRRAAEVCLARSTTEEGGPRKGEGLIGRLLAAARRLFSASA